MKEEQVILVNTNDEPIGLMNKLEAHEKAVLHRAFSVFVLNDKNEVIEKAQRVRNKFLSEEELILFDHTNSDLMTTAWSAKETLYKIAGRNKIDFKTELHLQPIKETIFKGSILTEGIRSSTEIHTFVEDSYVYTINESALHIDHTV